MAYFITGATGFIGRHLVERLLARSTGRIVPVHVLVREGSTGKLDSLIERWPPGAARRIRPVIGDLSKPRLGVSNEALAELSRTPIEHFFHLAAVYDMTAGSRRNRVANVQGTRHAVQLAADLRVGCLHHVSSIAVAGLYKGRFREDMFDEGQELDHPYHRTKFEAEEIVRTQTAVPWRVYRPAVVVGNSQTGEMDKIDGPYYFFGALKLARRHLPAWLPLIGPELGYTNIVPVDYVAAAIDHIAHLPGLDRETFQIAAPEPQRSVDVLNAFAAAAHAPRLSIPVDARGLGILPRRPLSLLMALPPARGLRRALLAEVGIPDQVLGYIGLTAEFDTRATQRALRGSEIELAPLEDYAAKLWNYWERKLDPDLFKDRGLEAVVSGKTVVITGASSGIGQAAAFRIARAGGIPILVARSTDKLEQTRREIEDMGGTAYAYSTDIADPRSVEDLCERLLADHPAIDILVNNAGRSIRRSIALSYDRFHDFERTIGLNYLGTVKLILGLLPHMRERRAGHIVNVSSIGVQASPPRFAAYVASKAALDAWTKVVGSECIGDDVHFTTIHMPLVRTPMIAPTKIYDSFPTISPDEAAEKICQAIRERPKHLGTRLGTLGEVSYALAPKAVDQILHTAYRVFPDSAAARGKQDPTEHASTEQLALAHLMRGVHW